MPTPDAPLERLGFLTIGLFDDADPAAGHRTTLEMIEFGERLGFSSAWVRPRHLQYGISSPVAVLAAFSRVMPGQPVKRTALFPWCPGPGCLPELWDSYRSHDAQPGPAGISWVVGGKAPAK